MAITTMHILKASHGVIGVLEVIESVIIMAVL